MTVILWGSILFFRTKWSMFFVLLRFAFLVCRFRQVTYHLMPLPLISAHLFTILLRMVLQTYLFSHIINISHKNTLKKSPNCHAEKTERWITCNGRLLQNLCSKQLNSMVKHNATIYSLSCSYIF